MATPLVLASAIMYYVFPDSMMKGQICKFYELASDKNDQADCIANYDANPDFYIQASGYRYTAFLAGLYLPVACSIVELFMNQLLMSWKHLVLAQTR